MGKQPSRKKKSQRVVKSSSKKTAAHSNGVRAESLSQVVQRANQVPHTLSPTDVMRLQHAFGNQAISKILPYTALKPASIQKADANPVAPPTGGAGSQHPQLARGDGMGAAKDKRVAVEEMQQKIKSALKAAGKRVRGFKMDGKFGPITEKYLKRFQKHAGLPETGIADTTTWAKLDEQGKSNIGRVEKAWTESLGNKVYGMTSRFTWEIKPKKMVVSVKLRFTGVQNNAVVQNIFGGIKKQWNVFNLAQEKKTPGKKKVHKPIPLEFNPRAVGSGEDNVVKLLAGNGRSDAGNWYLGDPDLVDKTGPHEFGHMIGLEDEYERSHTDYKRLVGKDPDPGMAKLPSGMTAKDFAKKLKDKLYIANLDKRVRDTYKFIHSEQKLKPGNFSKAAMSEYKKLTGNELYDDINSKINPAGVDPKTRFVWLWKQKYNLDSFRSWIIKPFLFESTSLMGNMASVGKAHEHPVEPRHVREFVGYVQQLKGGKWKAEYK